MAWVYLIANEIINLLQAVGLILNIPQILLGATVLAWGNAVGDVAADTILAKKGYPRIAMSAIYGGSMFSKYLAHYQLTTDLIFGLGLALIINTARSFPAPLVFSIEHRLFFVLSAFLFVCVLGSLILIGARNFKVDWPYAIGFILYYSAFLAVIILVAVKVIWPPV